MIFANKKEKKKFAYRENELPKIYYNFTDVFAKNKTKNLPILNSIFLLIFGSFQDLLQKWVGQFYEVCLHICHNCLHKNKTKKLADREIDFFALDKTLVYRK
jgi:hypothetical protein